MNKIYVATLLAATAITFVSAEDAKPKPTKAEMMRGSVEASVSARVAQMMPTTGDATIDAQIKALSVEMEAKVKAIRDDYTVKIKAAIGNKKVTPPMGTTTIMRGEPKREDHPMMEGDATNTPPTPRGDMEARGEMNTELKQVMPQDVGTRVKNFFRGFFGMEK